MKLSSTITVVLSLFWSFNIWAAPCENRAEITSSCECNGATVSSGYCCYNTVSNVDHQSDKCGYTEVSPHWEHILISKDDYRYPDPEDLASEIAWNAKHFDLVDFDSDRSSFDMYKAANPTAIYILYEIDMTSIASGYYSSIYNDLVAYAGSNLEDVFLHVSNNTTLTLPDDSTVSITGCEMGARSEACRLTTVIWGSRRWIINPKSEVVRNFFGEEWTKILTTASSDGNYYDGLFLDEHPLFPAFSVDSSPTAQVLEYGSKTWSSSDSCSATTNSFEQEYYGDFTDFVAAQMAGVPLGKKLIPNAAEYFGCPVSVDQSMAASGGFFEFADNMNSAKETLENLWNTADNLSAAGKSSIFVTRQKGADGKDYYPDGYDKGSYGSSGDRARIAELAIYYLGKDADNKHVYFDILGGWASPYTEVWPVAAEIDIGRATGDRYSFQTGTDPKGHSYEIFGRDFENGRVLYRPKAEWDYDDFGGSTKVKVTLPEELHPINSKGEDMGMTDEFELRNSEGVILVRDYSGPGGIKGSGGCSLDSSNSSLPFSLLVGFVIIIGLALRRKTFQIRP
jgi:hypothetical protein